MPAKGYTTEELVEDYSLTNIDDSFSDRITSWIISIEQYIDNFTGRNFKATPEPSEGDPRYYDGNGSAKLLIDDALEITSITIDGEQLDDDMWYKYPANETPKTKLVLKSGCFNRGNQNIEITGTWGYSLEVPADIQLAATVLVNGIMAHSNKKNKKVRQMTVGRYTVSYDSEKEWADFDQAIQILNSYKKYSF